MDATQLAELAIEIESADPIDWGMISLKPEEVYIKMANEVIKMYNRQEESEAIYAMLAITTKLLVENYILNLQLYGFRHYAI